MNVFSLFELRHPSWTLVLPVLGSSVSDQDLLYQLSSFSGLQA